MTAQRKNLAAHTMSQMIKSWAHGPMKLLETPQFKTGKVTTPYGLIPYIAPSTTNTYSEPVIDG
jgi:hypothetical protein